MEPVSHKTLINRMRQRKHRMMVKLGLRQQFCECGGRSVRKDGACERCAAIEQHMEDYHGSIHHEARHYDWPELGGIA